MSVETSNASVLETEITAASSPTPFNVVDTWVVNPDVNLSMSPNSPN